MQGKIGLFGAVGTRKLNMKVGPLWKLRNLKYMFPGLWRLFAARTMGIQHLQGALRLRLFKNDGSVVDYGLASLRLVTTAFVEYMVDQLIAETSAWGDFQFHDSGVGITAAAIGDTDIETTDGVARTDGTQLEGASGEIYRSVGTITYGGTLAITEHGLFNIVTGGILMDRHVFAAVNVVSGESIEFTYELTVNDGG